MSIITPIHYNINLGVFSVTPEDFGAVGDGTTDDTLAIQQALNEGKLLHLKSKYLITAPIETKESVIVGEGVNTGFILSDTAHIKITHSHAGLENMSIETKAGWSAEQAVLVEPKWNLTNNFIRDIFFYATEEHTSAAAIKLGSTNAGNYGIMNITIENIRTFDFGTVILFHRGPSWMSGGIIRNIFAGRAEDIIVCEGEDYIPAFTLFENIHGQYYASYTTQLFKDFAGKNCTIINPHLWDGGKFGNFSTKSRFNLIVGGHGAGNLPEDWKDEGYKNSFVNFYPAYGSYTRSRFWEFSKTIWTEEDKFFTFAGEGEASYSLGITPTAPKLSTFKVSAGSASGVGTAAAITNQIFQPYSYFMYRIRFIIDATSGVNLAVGLDTGTTSPSLTGDYIVVKNGETNFIVEYKYGATTGSLDLGKAVDTAWHEIQIATFNASEAIIYFDGAYKGTITTLPHSNMRIINSIESTEAATKSLYLTDLYLRYDVRLS